VPTTDRPPTSLAILRARAAGEAGQKLYWYLVALEKHDPDAHRLAREYVEASASAACYAAAARLVDLTPDPSAQAAIIGLVLHTADHP